MSGKSLYNYQWQKVRLKFLNNNPLCVFCDEGGDIVPATVVDHKKPHRGDLVLFWDPNNWQALCKVCHDSVKSRMESGKDVRVIGVDGWPLD